MPVLTSVNSITAVKPGATVLLERHRRTASEQVVLAWQRYGRGKALAFPVQDSWHWQMDVKMSLEDQTHENFWRQLLRWLVDGVPTPSTCTRSPIASSRASRSTLVADVVDAHVRRGERRARRREGHGAERGDERRADAVDRRAQRPVPRHVPTSAGWACTSAQVEAHARREAARHGRDATCAPRRATRSISTRRCTRRGCKRIAEDTGGRFYTPENDQRACRGSALHRPRRDRRSRSASSGTCRSC